MAKMKASSSTGSKVPGSRQRSSCKTRLEEKEFEKIVKQMENKVVKMREKTVRMKKVEKKSKVKLKKIEKQWNQLKKVKKQMLDESCWAQSCTDVMQGIVDAEDQGDFVTAHLLTRILLWLISSF